MKHFCFCLVIGLFAAGCKTPIKYVEREWQQYETGRNVPYKLATYPEKSAKLLLILPDNPDSTELDSSQIVRQFFEEGYNVLIPGKPGDDIHVTRSLDYKEGRINDINGLLSQFDSLRRQDLVIMGIGEGAYLVPSLSHQTVSSKNIMLNAGVYSPLHELEYISNADSLAPRHEKLLYSWGLSPEDLQYKLNNIKNNTFGTFQLPPSSNRNWKSYYDSPLINDLYKANQPILWLNFQEYPLLSIKGKELTAIIVKGRPKIKYRILEGSGSLHSEDLQKATLNEIEEFMRWR